VLVSGLKKAYENVDTLVHEWRIENGARVRVALIKREIQLAQEQLKDLEDERVGRGVKS